MLTHESVNFLYYNSLKQISTVGIPIKILYENDGPTLVNGFLMCKRRQQTWTAGIQGHGL